MLIPSATSTECASTVLVFMHPSAIMNLLPMPRALAKAGCHVLTCASRYPNNDTGLMMEKVVKDLGSVVAHCKDVLEYDRVVLAGWSGGGSLSAFYQSQAESPSVTTPIALTDANLPPAEGLLLMAAHSSRAKILTEWLDPSIWLLRRGAPWHQPALDCGVLRLLICA